MLKSYRDGEPIAERRKVIEAHLSACALCREEFLRIQEEQGEPDSVPSISDAPEPDSEGLSAVLARIRTWESSRARPEVRGPAIRRRVVQEIGLYLGGKAAQRIIEPVSDDGGNLLPAIQPFLGRFLGQKAASHLSSHIVEVAVVRT